MSKPQTKVSLPSSFGTDCIHAGQEPDPVTGAVIMPISTSTTFAQKSPGQGTAFEYSRSDNPNRHALEANVAKLENGKHGFAFGSGSAATASLVSLLSPGDHVIVYEDVYGGTSRYFRKVASVHGGLSVTFVNVSDEEAFRAAFTDKTKMVWVETPSNPLLRVVDVEKAAKITHEHGAILVTDNTFLSPFFQRPLDFGSDFVMHSVSKYLNGHSDVIMGLVVTKDDALAERLRFLQNGIGAVPAPFDCAMVVRSLKTLHVRMAAHERNAFAVARFLEAHPRVSKVHYPGLESHPDHETACKQQNGFGGMVTCWVEGGLDQARAFLETVKVFTLAESLGGVESLVEHPAIMTHASIEPDVRAKLGIDDTLIRLSVGIEDEADIIADLTAALDAMPAVKA